MLYVIGGRESRSLPDGARVINTTSRSHGWSGELSPFFLGPASLYDGSTAKNVENAWQFSKVYPGFTKPDGSPSDEYFQWARSGWQMDRAVRYPMKKGAVPLYSFWNGKKLDYIAARKNIYIPLYADAVKKTTAWDRLKKEYQEHRDLYLWDFDGYNYHAQGMSLTDVVNNKYRKMGHAFVLAMLLEYGEEFHIENMNRRYGPPEQANDHQITLF